MPSPEASAPTTPEADVKLVPWNTQITLSKLDESQLTPEQESIYLRFISEIEGDTIEGHALGYSGTSRRLWHFGLRVMDAPDEVAAVKASTRIVINGIGLAGVNLGEVEFIKVHSASDARIENVAQMLRKNGFLDMVRVGDETFNGRDTLRNAARSVFTAIHNDAEALSAISADGIEPVPAQPTGVLAPPLTA